MRRLCLFSCGFAAAAAMKLWLLDGFSWLLPALLAAACALLFLLRSAYARRAAILVLGLLLGFVWCHGYEALFLRPFASLSGQTCSITAQALRAPQQTSYANAVDVRLTLGNQTCDAVLYYDEADGQILPGSRLSCTAKLTAAQDRQTRSGDYDRSRGVFLAANCRGTLHTASAEPSVRFAPARLSVRLQAAIRQIFAADTAGFLQALLLGDKSALSYADKNDLALAGIYHAVAVSGMHVSILLGMILLLCGGNRPLAAALGIPVSVFFIIMTGAPASAVRAGIMQAMVLCAPLVRRENDPPTTICLALLVLLLQNPWAMLNVGLQLSFTSTAGIVLFAGRIYRSLSSAGPVARLLRCRALCGLPRAMLTAFSCTVSSMVFALPVTALQFGMVSLAAPVVNVLGLWMLSLVFCGGMLTALLALAVPGVAAACAWVLSWPVRLVWLLVRSAAGLPFAALYLENGYLVTAAVFVYALALLLALRPGRVRLWQAAAAAVIVIGCCMGLSCADYALAEESFTMLDVGQGQCLIRRAEGSVSVIDCGGQADASGECAARYLLARGVSRVDRLILTHFDADHCNGVCQLLGRVSVGTLYVPDLSVDSPLRTKLLFCAAQAGTQIRFVTEDLHLPEPGLTIYAPIGEADTPNAGLCVLASGEKYDILITGDLSTQAEYRLLSTHAAAQAGILVAGHHGASSSTSAALLRAVRPSVVLISVGADNRFGHPADDVLRRIAAAGASVWRTDVSGTITIRG